MELDFELELEKVYKALGDAKILPLATSSHNRTTTRMMSCILYNGAIVFQTSVDLLKYTQISENPLVALCFNNIQIEGSASILGKMSDEKNKDIMKKYKAYYKSSYDTYSHMEKERLIMTTISRVTLWDYDDGKPYRIFIDIGKKQAIKEMYSLA
jgi:general stress protein 26